MNVLLVEDDSLQAESVGVLLSSAGFQVSRVSHGENAVQFLKNNPVELVVLDWQIPKISGLDVLRWIRTYFGPEPAVLFHSARTLEVDIATAFNAGADEYVIKPLRSIEFIARVKALLRRRSPAANDSTQVRTGKYILDPVLKEIQCDGIKIELTEKEFLVASYLFNHIGQVVSRDLLCKLVWGRDPDGFSRSVDTHIYRIRRKLALRPENGLRLCTIYSHGYRLEEIGTPITPPHMFQDANSCLTAA